MRSIYVIAILYCAICVLAIGITKAGTTYTLSQSRVRNYGSISDSRSAWFTSARLHCNPVEVEAYLVYHPAPDTYAGRSFAAACLALAGKTDRAQSILEQMSATQQQTAVETIFEIAHPVADAGDDKSAADIMRLVLHFSPSNVMALYHAGMSEFQQHDIDTAKKHLSRFVELYQQDDAFRKNAQRVLDQLSPY